MKKILLLIACVMASIGSVGAMEINSDTSFLSIPYSEEELNNMAKENDYFEIARNEVYTITSYKTNSSGQIIDENTIIATEEEANKVANDDSLFVGSNGKLQKKNLISTLDFADADEIQTESKKVGIIYVYDSGKYKLGIQAQWTKLPKIRVFDVLALRWTSNATVSHFHGKQVSDEKTTNYDSSTGNLKKGTKGIGCSMNLHNNASSKLVLDIYIESSSPFGDVYGTYQHAKNSNATLAISKSYTFGSSGLGGVLVFSNKTYKSYYDNTPGLQLIGN